MFTTGNVKTFSVFIFSALLGIAAQAQTDSTETAEIPQDASTNTMVNEPAEASPAISAEGNYQCALNGLVRRVEIAYETADAKVPCSVNYYKDSEAPDEVSTLWSAQNMVGYCEEKASQFVEKLQSWGWSCSLQ